MENEGVLSEILSRVGRKAIYRFKCVSKLWYEIITKTLPRTNLGFYTFTNPNSSSPFDWFLSPTITLSFKQRIVFKGDPFAEPSFNLTITRTSTILDSFNGLFLIHDYATDTFSVSNPATKQSANLPPPNYPKDRVRAFGLAPSNNSKHYYVVHLIADSIHGNALFEIFSSFIGTWKLINQATPYLDLLARMTSVQSFFFEGSVHWFWGEKNILVYHLRDEFAEYIELPAFTEKLMFSRLLFESEGRLCYCYVDSCLEIYELFKLGKHYGHGYKWVKKHSTNVQSLMSKYPKIFERVRWPTIYLLGFSDLLQMVLLQFRESVIAYDPETGEVKEVCKNTGHIHPFVYRLTNSPIFEGTEQISIS